VWKLEKLSKSEKNLLKVSEELSSVETLDNLKTLVLEIYGFQKNLVVWKLPMVEYIL